MNYKIEVKSKEQADEAESLASDLGYAMDDTFSEKWSDRYCYLLLCGDMSAGFGCELMEKGDEPMSMTELRALVSLHKNPINMDKVLSEVRSDALGLLNNQYAEIEQVRQASIADTLNERQSTYGSFEDVANTTQYLLQMLSTDAMSDVQLEALHMICSKLARIAHGDPNYKDNWHDIAGYATLVERSL